METLNVDTIGIDGKVIIEQDFLGFFRVRLAEKREFLKSVLKFEKISHCLQFLSLKNQKDHFGQNLFSYISIALTFVFPVMQAAALYLLPTKSYSDNRKVSFIWKRILDASSK